MFSLCSGHWSIAMYDGQGLGLLLLKRPLSGTSNADPDDVLSTKSALGRLGYYQMPTYGLTPYPDQQLFDGIRQYRGGMGSASTDTCYLAAKRSNQSTARLRPSADPKKTVRATQVA
jgi:hypothetical protein